MRIAIVVHGRFHAFDLARALVERGHEVRLFTNYPKRIVRKWNVPAHCVKSFLLHGALARIAARIDNAQYEPVLHPLFGRWAARQVAREEWDLLYVFSGVAEEVFRAPLAPGVHRSLMRGSAHILTQDRLLQEEQQRAGFAIQRPSRWMKERELREYQLADSIVVLSSFAAESFVEHGVPQEKLLLVPLGVDTSRFRPGPEVIAERLRRIRSGEPLRALFTGTFSYQKGILDFAEIVRRLHGLFCFRFIGDVPEESRALARELTGLVEFVERQSQFDLPGWYSQADLFLFPTIQDGFAVVLSQALAGALPVLATSNCSSRDIVRHGETGWVLPIRDPDAFIARLKWCDAHRESLAEMVQRSYEEFRPRDWKEAAVDFERAHLARVRPVPVGG